MEEQSLQNSWCYVGWNFTDLYLLYLIIFPFSPLALNENMKWQYHVCLCIENRPNQSMINNFDLQLLTPLWRRPGKWDRFKAQAIGKTRIGLYKISWKLIYQTGCTWEEVWFLAYSTFLTCVLETAAALASTPAWSQTDEQGQSGRHQQ